MDPRTCPTSTSQVELNEAAGVRDLSRTKQLAKFIKGRSAERQLPEESGNQPAGAAAQLLTMDLSLLAHYVVTCIPCEE